MVKTLLKKIIAEIENNFTQFEEYLLSPAQFKEFKKYLSNYRGMNDKIIDQTFEIHEAAEKNAESIVNFFINIFSKNGLAEENEENICFILNEVEKIVNLTLYYWFGLNDRNYQFRALIHFYQIEGLGAVFLTKNKLNFAVSLSEDGIRFGNSESSHEPKILPVSKVCELRQFTIYTNERDLFARTRTIQREICLLIDEWEHLNSILAVEYGQIYHELQQNQNKKNVEAFEAISLKMNKRRDSLALWCLESFCDFQEWISEILTQNSSKNLLCDDILAEIDAASAVLLSGFQKIFLPASVSRHRYCDDVLPFFQKFAQARLKLYPDDLSSMLLQQVVLCSFGNDIDKNILSYIDKKAFEWRLSFDPSSAVKAFSWKYSKDMHNILCMIYGICFLKKIIPNMIDPNFISDIATALQMPDTFPEGDEKRVIYTQNSTISDTEYENLVKTMTFILDNYTKQNKNNNELIIYIKTTLQQKRLQVE